MMAAGRAGGSVNAVCVAFVALIASALAFAVASMVSPAVAYADDAHTQLAAVGKVIAQSENEDVVAAENASGPSEPIVTIQSITKAGASHLKISWEADAGASRFQVLRSANENYGYKVIAIKKAIGAKNDANKVKSAYTDKKVKKGTTYYYRVRAVYPKGGEVESASCGQMIPKKTSVLRRSIKTAAPNWIGKWQADDLYYYVKKGRVHIVYLDLNNKLLDYALNSRLKVSAIKVVKLPQSATFSGFYHGPDGNNYVLLGYDNKKKSKTKTAMKVVKYNGSWKKGKATAIKGGFTSEGIYSLRHSSRESMCMRGRTLYVYATYRTFYPDDRYLDYAYSGFSCPIDTKTMKVTGKPRSFDYKSQGVRIKDGNVYQAFNGRAQAAEKPALRASMRMGRRSCVPSRSHPSTRILVSPVWKSDRKTF